MVRSRDCRSTANARRLLERERDAVESSQGLARHRERTAGRFGKLGQYMAGIADAARPRRGVRDFGEASEALPPGAPAPDGYAVKPLPSVASRSRSGAGVQKASPLCFLNSSRRSRSALSPIESAQNMGPPR